jgi:hypothetical protein
MQNKPNLRHKATFRLSHFLNSKESLLLDKLTGGHISILYYMFSVMDMNFNSMGKEICDKSYAQIALYSRTSSRTVKRVMIYFTQHNLIKSVSAVNGRCTIYSIGSGLEVKFQKETEAMVTSDLGHHGTGQIVTGATMAQDLGHHGPGPRPPWPTSNNSCNNFSNKREREALPTGAKTTGAKSPALSLSNFNPNEENRILATELQLTLQDEIASFKNRHTGKGDLQYEFARWLKNSRQYHARHSSNNGHSGYGQNNSNVDPYAHLENWTEKRLAREAEERRNNARRAELETSEQHPASISRTQ